MRIFNSFPEAFNEIRRDLAEMGLRVKTETMQDKVIINDPGYETLELQNYIYKVTGPKIEDLKPTQPWADHDWPERWAGAMGNPQNPGAAYKLRSDVWDEFLHDGKFAYTYSERLAASDQVRNVIRRLKRDPNSRQLYIAMWQPDDSNYFGTARVPCSLGWHLLYRGGLLHLTYFMRSCDFATHFQNDVFMSMMILKSIAEEVGMKVGYFTHYISSFHVYQKDVDDVF